MFTSNLINVFAEPVRLYDNVKSRPNAAAPLLLPTLLMAAVTLFYFQRVDFTWLVEHIIAARSDLSDASREAVMRTLNRNMLTWTSVISALLASPALIALFAAYLLMAGRICGADLGYKQWLALSAWCAMPRLIVVVLMALQVARMDGGRLGTEELDLTSLNSMLLSLPLEHAWSALASSVNLTTIWMPILAGYGFKRWTGASSLLSIAIAAAPLTVVFGLWAIKITLGS